MGCLVDQWLDMTKLTYKKNPIKLMFPYLLGTEFKDNIIEWILTCSSYKQIRLAERDYKNQPKLRPFSLKPYIAFCPTLCTSNYICQLKKEWQPTPVFLPGESQGLSPEKSGVLQSMGSQRVGHDWVTNTYRSHISRVSWYQFVDNRIVKRFLIFFFERVSDASHIFYSFW